MRDKVYFVDGGRRGSRERRAKPIAENAEEPRTAESYDAWPTAFGRLSIHTARSAGHASQLLFSSI